MTDSTIENSGWKKIRSFLGSNYFRFGLAAILIIVVFAILAREIHPSQIEEALKKSNPWWVVGAALVAALSWVGAAVPFKELARIKIPFKDAALVQVASSFVGVAAPMGLGPVALHIDYMKKRGMETASAIAVVAFIEIAQIVTSVSMLIVALLFDHKFPHIKLPLREILIIASIVVGILLLSLVIKQVRAFIGGKIKEFWNKIVPEIDRIKDHPIIILWSVLGVFLQTFTYALALVFCMYSVGHPITIAMGVTIYLIGNTIGAAVPVPGGIGSTLAATVGALTLMGVPTALAATATVIFRLVTFYLQVPIGAIAFTYMQRKKLL